MSRYFYLGILVLGILGIVISFLYKTPSVELAATGYFGGVSLRLEYAMTPEARERGLGGRTEILEDYGMLFVFAEDDTYGFWMKDMLVPIDIFWLNAQGQVVSIAANVAPSTYPNVFYPSLPAQYVLETAAGFTTRTSIATGTPLLLKNFPTVLE